MIEPFDPAEAERHKIIFYRLPQDLNLDEIDPLMRPVVRRINESGWVWTAECCQGHPDYNGEGAGWDHNVKPFLRLVTSKKTLGEMMGALASSMRLPDRVEGWPPEKMRCDVTCSFTTHVWSGDLGPWEQVLIYVEAHNVLTRDRGIEALAAFAERINDRPFFECPGCGADLAVERCNCELR